MTRSLEEDPARSRLSDFLEVDTRWLALLRIAAGLLAFVYLGTLAGGDRLVGYFSDQGMFPLDALQRYEPAHVPFTTFRFARTPDEVAWQFAALFALAGALTVGVGTRIAAPLLLAGIVSLHHRIPWVVNGGMGAIPVLFLPWVFLPLGRHLSVDERIAARFGRSGGAERIRTLAPLLLRVQLAAVYFFNAVHKSGRTWLEGDALHYVLYSSRAVWPWTVRFRTHEPSWFSPVFGYAALALELAIPILLLVPFHRRLARRGAVAGIVLLHGGIACLMNVGPFPFVFLLAAFALLASESGEHLRFVADASTTRRSCDDGTWGRVARVAHGAREAAFVGYGLLTAYLLWDSNPGARWAFGAPPQFGVAHDIAHVAYLGQRWAMFAPNAPTMDRFLMPVVELEDGRVLTVESRRAPSFAGPDERYVPTDFFLQIHESRMVSAPDPFALEAYARACARRFERESPPGTARVVRLIVHEFLLERRPLDEPHPWHTRTTVAYWKEFLPVERPGARGP